MIKVAKEVTGRKIHYEITGRRPGDAVKLLADSKKAKNLLGWYPKNSNSNVLIQSMWEVYKNFI